MSMDISAIPNEQLHYFSATKSRFENQLRIFSELYNELKKSSKVEEEKQVEMPLAFVFEGRGIERKFIGEMNDKCGIHCGVFASIANDIGYCLSVSFRLAICGDNGIKNLNDWYEITREHSYLEKLEITGTYIPKSTQGIMGWKSHYDDIEKIVHRPSSESIVYKILSLYKQKMGVGL